MLRDSLVLLVLMSLSAHSFYIDIYYEHLRNFTSGVLTGFEGPKYMFPMDLCLNQSSTIAVDDDLISAVMYASLQNWTAVNMYLDEARVDFYGAVDGCDYLKIVDSALSWYNKLDIASFMVKAWWNSILIGRNSYSFYGIS
jgi:hypothetical protein